MGGRAAHVLLDLLWRTGRKDEFAAELARLSSSVEPRDYRFERELNDWWAKLDEGR